jgi:uncharacterized small protein (DUF1192 family)
MIHGVLACQERIRLLQDEQHREKSGLKKAVDRDYQPMAAPALLGSALIVDLFKILFNFIASSGS